MKAVLAIVFLLLCASAYAGTSGTMRGGTVDFQQVSESRFIVVKVLGAVNGSLVKVLVHDLQTGQEFPMIAPKDSIVQTEDGQSVINSEISKPPQNI